MKMKKIVCGEDNVESFRGELKAAAPEFYYLAKELYAAGMIEGLRGATFEISPVGEQGSTQPQIEAEAINYCDECSHWCRDSIGDGSGIGQCLLNARASVLKWPKQVACDQFEALA